MHGHFLSRAVILLLALALPLAAAFAAGTTDFSAQREIFKDARKALKKGDLKTYRRLLTKLDGYPLKVYLEYDYLRGRLSTQSPKTLRAFLAANDNSSVGSRMRVAWLYHLAKKNDWHTFVAEYHGSTSAKLQCHHAWGRLKTGAPMAEVDAEIAALWVVDHSQPKECDALFKKWIDGGGANTERVWQRIALAMDNRQLSLGTYLGRFLSESDRKWVERWQRMHKDPVRELKSSVYQQDLPVVRDIVAHGVKRLARRNADMGYAEWERLRGDYKFSAEQIADVENYMAMRAVYQRRDSAHARLAAIDPTLAEPRVREWRVRTALRKQDWPAVLEGVRAIGVEESDNDAWRYWRARALEQTGREAEARRLYAAIAADHGYHSFLASDRLDVPYTFNDQAVEFTDEELEAASNIPGILRARELFLLGETRNARREWHYTIKQLEPRQLELAAVLAYRWGWHDRAIITVARAKHWTDLELRFPILYRQEVELNAQRNNLDTAWVFGVMRQESAYMADVRSSAGAMGLMQLMPATAKQMARRINSPLKSNTELYNPDKNIRLGTAYLRTVLDKQQGHQVLATASYNAGPHRVTAWLPKKAGQPADIWVENIPFNETRGYVRRVMSYTAIFEKRLGQPVTPLARRMPDIQPSS